MWMVHIALGLGVMSYRPCLNSPVLRPSAPDEPECIHRQLEPQLLPDFRILFHFNGAAAAGIITKHVKV